ncbi:MAG TPA: UDP-glucose 4-epimerase GalE, partial [Geobacterales bacterium]|nr:UDP-glucose 4-epimerase GalE [Geobacterales bacterium]
MAKVLVVGGAGYIGSHMVRELLAQGFTPTVLDNLSAGHRWALPDGLLVEGDLRDRQLLDELFVQGGFEAVLHFASSIQVGESVVKPLKYYNNNVCTTINLLAAMERHGVKRFVFSSTAAVYGTPEQFPISEDAPLHPENPYGRSKLMVEEMLMDCEVAWGLRSARLRYFNAAGADPAGGIGEAHNPETHLIPLILQVAAGRRTAITVNGADYPTPDGTCIR